LKVKKVRDVIKEIEHDGWYFVRQNGSHRHYKHKIKKGLVTISGNNLNHEIPKGTLRSIYIQAQIKED